jgi:hypothetical protein
VIGKRIGIGSWQQPHKNTENIVTQLHYELRGAQYEFLCNPTHTTSHKCAQHQYLHDSAQIT